MKQNFKPSLARVLLHEGGYANHPRDPGGATMKGVTHRVYKAYRARLGLPPRDVRKITKAEIEAIYRQQYWDVVRGDELPSGLDYTVFDAAVNSGPSRAAKWLQAAVGSEPDGIIGENTLAAVRAANAVETIREFNRQRLSFVKGLSTWGVFGRGWQTRIDDVRAHSLRMTAGGESEKKPRPAPVAAKATAKADEADKTTLTIYAEEGKGEATLGIGAVGEGLRSVADTLFPFTEISQVLKWVFIALILVGTGLVTWKLIRKYTRDQRA